MSGDTGEFTLQAGEQKQFPAAGSNYLNPVKQTGFFQVKLLKNNTPVETHNIANLATLIDKDFDEFIIVNTSDAAITVRLFYGQGQYVPTADGAEVTINNDEPIDVNMLGASVTIIESQPNDIVPLSDVAVGNVATLITAAAANSLYVEISIPEDQTNGIRIGDSTVTAVKGRWLGPGMSSEINIANHAIYGIRDGDTNVTVTITRLDSV